MYEMEGTKQGNNCVTKSYTNVQHASIVHEVWAFCQCHFCECFDKKWNKDKFIFYFVMEKIDSNSTILAISFIITNTLLYAIENTLVLHKYGDSTFV